MTSPIQDVSMDWSENIPTVVLNGTVVSFESIKDAQFVFDLLNKTRAELLKKERQLENIMTTINKLQTLAGG